MYQVKNNAKIRTPKSKAQPLKSYWDPKGIRIAFQPWFFRLSSQKHLNFRTFTKICFWIRGAASLMSCEMDRSACFLRRVTFPLINQRGFWKMTLIVNYISQTKNEIMIHSFVVVVLLLKVIGGTRGQGWQNCCYYYYYYYHYYHYYHYYYHYYYYHYSKTGHEIGLEAQSFKHIFMDKEKFIKGCAPLKWYLSDGCWNIYKKSSCLLLEYALIILVPFYFHYELYRTVRYDNDPQS